MTVPSGERVGETSLIEPLLRLYDPDDGTVSPDGHDFRRLRSVARAIGYVGQDPFDGTVTENVAYGDPDASRVPSRRRL